MPVPFSTVINDYQPSLSHNSLHLSWNPGRNNTLNKAARAYMSPTTILHLKLYNCVITEPELSLTKPFSKLKTADLAFSARRLTGSCLDCLTSSNTISLSCSVLSVDLHLDILHPNPISHHLASFIPQKQEFPEKNLLYPISRFQTN